MDNFSVNPTALLSESASYLKEEGDTGNSTSTSASNTENLIGKFASFLTNSAKENSEGILTAFKIALVASSVYNLWIIDLGVTDHITNVLSNLYDLEEISSPTHMSVANGNQVFVKGQGKIKILSLNTSSSVLYVPTFPFKLLSIGRITRTLKYCVIFDVH